MRRLIATVAAVLALSLSGCTAEPDHGVVIGKHHDDGYQSWMLCGKTLCPYYVPDASYLKLHNESTEAHRQVSSDEYAKYKEGDTYP
ncbi:hypothetical protein [Mycobacteroides chelonae]|uniref:hypothetical protein n=1 Tax=Mycobacteroides chelonae TaxID=1774 RepID=UPI0012FF857E|nr:hypothetical protein [Mycobacteroides chelonae]